MGAGHGHVVARRGLVPVGRSPDVAVGHRAEVRDRLDGLMRRSVLSKSDPIAGGSA